MVFIGGIVRESITLQIKYHYVCIGGRTKRNTSESKQNKNAHGVFIEEHNLYAVIMRSEEKH